MKAELTFPLELVDQIADKVIEKIKPLLSGNVRQAETDIIFTPETLAEYLQVDTSWVYKQVTLKTIPYFKSGKYTRFRRSAIDRWIDSQTVKAIPSLKLIKGCRWP